MQKRIGGRTVQKNTQKLVEACVIVKRTFDEINAMMRDLKKIASANRIYLKELNTYYPGASARELQFPFYYSVEFKVEAKANMFLVCHITLLDEDIKEPECWFAILESKKGKRLRWELRKIFEKENRDFFKKNKITLGKPKIIENFDIFKKAIFLGCKLTEINSKKCLESILIKLFTL